MNSQIDISCEKSNLAHVREFVSSWLKKWNIVGVVANQIVLAVDEACANCMIHQNNCTEGRSITVRVFRDNSAIEVEIQDFGQGFPIQEYSPQPIEKIIEDKKKGGFGIFIIKSIMDEIEMDQHADYFVYRFRKHIPEEHPHNPHFYAPSQNGSGHNSSHSATAFSSVRHGRPIARARAGKRDTSHQNNDPSTQPGRDRSESRA